MEMEIRKEGIIFAVLAVIAIAIYIVLPYAHSDDIILIDSGGGSNVNNTQIIAGTGISVTDFGNGTFIVTNTAPDNTNCVNLGTVGEGIYVSGECNFKKVVAGNGISFGVNGTRIIFTNSLPESTTCGNTGTGNKIHKIGTNCTANSLIAGTGISITNTTDDYTFTNTLPEQGCTSAGGTSIWKTSSTCDAKGLAVTSPVTLTSNTNDLTIACPTCVTTTLTFSEIERQSPADGGTTFTTDTFTAHKYLKLSLYIRGNAGGATSGDVGLRFNADTGANYNDRCSSNLAAQTTNTGANQIKIFNSMDDDNIYFGNANYDSVTATTKIGVFDGAVVTGVAGNIPRSVTCYGSWDNTANQITSITIFRIAGTWTFDQTTELVVYGAD